MRLLDSDEQTEQTVFLSDVNNFHQVATYLSYNQPSGIDSMIKLQVHLICKKHRLLKDQYLVFLGPFAVHEKSLTKVIYFCSFVMLLDHKLTLLELLHGF